VKLGIAKKKENVSGNRFVKGDSDDDNRERPNTASLSSRPLSRKRLLERKESSDDTHTRDKNDPGRKIATGSAEFVTKWRCRHKRSDEQVERIMQSESVRKF
jgi:hypothetical protein